MTAKIKLNAASGGGSISIQAPSSSSNNRVISLPDIADGTLLTSQSSLDSTKLSPAITAGITYANIYRLHTNFTHSGTHTILTNWEEADDGSSGKLGSGWSLPSSGVFSFPATGIYLVRVRYNIRCTGENGWPGLDIKVTQKTAWFMLQRIRKCFNIGNNNDLNNDVEIGETYIDSKNKNSHTNKKV